MDKLAVRSMASGHLYLEISQSVGWAEFPKYADGLVSKLGAAVMDKAETAEMRIWQVSLQGCTLRLVWEDYPSAVSFESTSDDGDRLVRELKEKFESGAVSLR